VPRSRAAPLPSALLPVLLALAGCAGLRTVALPDLELPPSWESRRSALQAWPGYDLRGRVAVARGDDGFSGALRWVQAGARVRLELDGPLGVGGARYDLDPATVDGAALEQALGVPVPVASLRYWLLGVPDPALAVEESLEAGAPRLAALRQAGWSVVYARYAAVPGTRLELPQRIEVTREGVRLRLLVEDWQGVRP
jgi:outer membrane lipoprotein LolB